MNVVFASTSTTQRKYVLDIGIRHITFVDGRFSTTDKDIVKRIMQRPDFRNGQIIMVTEPKLVAEYLSGKEPDYLDLETVEEVSDAGIVKLAEYFDLPVKEPSMARYSLIGLAVDNYVSDVINTCPKEEGEIDYLQVAIEEGLVEKRSHWYYINDGSENRQKFHGPKATTMWLKDHYHELKLQGIK